jgi:glycerophosphoryl diester phosphodiesterase
MNETPLGSSGQPAPRPASIPTLARSALGDFRHILKPLMVFEGFLKGTVAVGGLIGTAYVVAPLIARTGRAAVTNSEIAAFLLSPEGLTVGFLIVFGTLFASVIEHVGVMAIVAMRLRGASVTPERILNALAAVLFRLIKFQLKGLGAAVLVSSPFVALAGLAYLAFLNQHDINFYLENRPPAFYLAVGIGGVLAIVLSIILIRLFVQAVFVIPSLIVGNLDSWSAVQKSRELTRGALRRIGGILVGWHAVGMLLGILAVWGFSRAACLLLAASVAWPKSLVPIVGLLLVAQVVLLSLVSTLLVAVESILILRLYFERTGFDPEVTTPESDMAQGPVGPLTSAVGLALRSARRFWLIVGFGTAVGIGMLLVGLARRLDVRPKVTVAAHRGYSLVAPENTLAAFRKSIEVGADYVELDVQETKDGRLIVNHDRDMMRVAGDPRRVAELTLAEIKTLDVGRRIGPEFVGERVPTLDEVIDQTRGKIGLQIELKYYAKDDGLAEKVAALIDRLKFEAECVVISLDYEALLKAKARNPRVKTAAIITYALGDVNRLDVDALSVHTKFIDNRLLREAKTQGKPVYAWTVDDPHQMLALIERGVSSLVTNVPSLAVSLRRELDGLSDVQRRILAARYLLGLEPDLVLDGSSAGPSTDVSTPD